MQETQNIKGHHTEEGCKGPRAPRPRERNRDVPSGLHNLTERGAYTQGYLYIVTNETGDFDAVNIDIYSVVK
jgi:hypothetical protein